MEDRIAIVTDGGSDLQEFPEIQKLTEATNVPVYTIFGDVSYSTNDMTMNEYHAKLNDVSKKEWPTTSAPSPQDFIDAYEKLKSEGYTKILSLHLAQKLSGTLNSANSAKNSIEGVEIELVDSLSASIGELAAVIKAYELISSEMGFQEVVSSLREFCNKSVIYVTLDTLDYLAKGGRISNVKYRLGKLLRMKPIITVSDGVINTYDKTRNITKSREKVYGYISNKYSTDDKFTYIIGHTLVPDIANEFDKKIKQEYPNSKGFVGEIGVAIATHVGPGAIGIITFD